MKFIVSSKQLYQKLQAAVQVINKKNTLPILDCFLLGLRGNILNIAATDGEVRLVTKIEVVEAKGDLRIAINAKNLIDPLKEIPDQPITFEVNENNLEIFIHYRNGKFNFIGQSADDYPIPKPLDDKVKQELLIEPDVLLNGISETLFASADDELRPVMNGIYFDITPSNITFVASDGHKLVRLIHSDTKGTDKSSFILPKKGASVIKKLLEKHSDSVKIKFDFNNAVFELSDFTITTRFIDGRYPNYNSVIPQDNPNKVLLDKDILLSVIKRVSVFANDASNLVKLDLSNDSIKVSCQDIDFSTASEENIELEYNGTPMSIGFKASFLCDILSNIKSSEVEVQLSDPSKAVLVVPTQSNSGWSNTSLIMPMMLNG